MQVKTKTGAQRRNIDNPAENRVSETIIPARTDGEKVAGDGRGTFQAPAETPKGFPFHVALPRPLFESLSDEHLRRDSGIGSSSLCTTSQSSTSSCRDSDEGTDADQASRDPLDGSSLFNTPSSFSSSCGKHPVLMASTGDLDQDTIVAYGAGIETGEPVGNIDGIGGEERGRQRLHLVPPIPWNAHSNQSETSALDRQDFGPTSKQLVFVSLSAALDI
jgi:hypothetical protein